VALRVEDVKDYFRSMSFTSPRDVYLSASARGVSQLGDFLAATSLVLALQARGASSYAVAAVLAAAALPPVVLAPLAGRVVDRFDSRVILTSVGLAQAACCALMAYVRSPWLLVILAALLAAGLAFTTPTFSALLPDMAGRDGIGRAMAISQTAGSIGALAGPALAGVLVGLYGLQVPLLVDAASYLAVVGAGLLLQTRRIAVAVPVAVSGEPWRTRSDPLLTMQMVMVGALTLTVNTTMVALVFFVRGSLGGSAASYGLIEATWTGTMLVGGWLAALRVRGDASIGRLLVVGNLAMAALITVAGLVPAYGWLFPLWALGGFANGVGNNFLGVLAARRVPRELRGQYFAKFIGVVNATNLIGFVLAGVLVDRFSAAAVITGGGLGGLAAMAALTVPAWRAASRPPAGLLSGADSVAPATVDLSDR
jgi:MFS family permease